MARENQGLHIALIIFVTLTLVLGVTTFIFFRKLEESTIKAKTDSDAAATARLNAEKSQRENEELKKMMGFGEKIPLDTVHEDFNKDMETYATNLPEGERQYRKVVEDMFKVIAKKDASLVELQGLYAAEQLRNENREPNAKSQVAVFQAGQEKAQQDLVGERAKFNDARTKITAEKDELAVKLDKAQKDAVATVDKIKKNLDETQKSMEKLQRSLQDRSEQLNKVVAQTFEEADGKIRWVNQRNRTVWVNLGQADGLPRQTTFAVYPSDASDVTQANKKASIEVTQVLGDHLAEARIVDDSITDPILPGDLIHTPIWTPGERQRFALSDGMDVDGDGRSDLELVRSLITMANGTIVAELDDKGNRTGKMDTNTRYLILGKQHDENTAKAVGEARVRMIREADTLGIQKVPLSELLKKMGYRTPTPVVRYGPGANPADFRPQPEGGVTRSSGNSVSPLFQPRKPPQNTRGSAY